MDRMVAHTPVPLQNLATPVKHWPHMKIAAGETQSQSVVNIGTQSHGTFSMGVVRQGQRIPMIVRAVEGLTHLDRATDW